MELLFPLLLSMPLASPRPLLLPLVVTYLVADTQDEEGMIKMVVRKGGVALLIVSCVGQMTSMPTLVPN